MASPTFLEMQDDVLSRDYGSTADRTNVKRWINDALRDVTGRWRWSWAEFVQTVSSTAGVETITLPTTLTFLGRLVPANASTPKLTWLDLANLEDGDVGPLNSFNPTTTRGAPKYVSKWANTLYLRPTPDAVYTWTLFGWQTSVALTADADTPAMPPEDRDVLVYGALVRAAERDRNPQMAQYWQTAFDTKLMNMRQKDTNDRMATRRVPMPGTYRRKYDP